MQRCQHLNKHSNSQFDNEIKKLSDKQKNIKNNLNAINFKEGNQESKYKKMQMEGNIVMRQIKGRKGKTNLSKNKKSSTADKQPNINVQSHSRYI